ncbi:MAG: 2-hydroxy-acid oxidase [Planctomycetaceae bacterium]|nr:2-hydroxy-acid oxidase [Planctomycetaceae bacterium]MBP62485.1 2-hydroxy-acid oxidase [Planctomycetaceae bacterium]
MQHTIPVDEIGPWGQPMAEAVQKCVHCGFCLPVCPTYRVWREEMDSPRGRIVLMKEVLEGRLEFDEALPYVDRCLGCVGCETACPSGVGYGELLTSFRGLAEASRNRSLLDRVLRWFVLTTLPYPARFRWGARMGRWAKPLRGLVPGRLGNMLDLLPSTLPHAERLPEVYPAEGPRRARVALLAGCAQQVLAPDINWATLRVLAKNGVEVIVPQEQACCGALAAHTGAAAQARRFARHNLQVFPDDVDAILTNAAGCGSGMHEYALWLRGEPEEAVAEAFVQRVRDVTEFLADVGICTIARLEKPTRVAMHDACHLVHAQGIRQQPRELLATVENLELVEIPESDICCGSAGTYNIEQPQTAAELGQKKAAAIGSTDTQVVAAGNIGCMTQINTHLIHLNRHIPVMHTMQILDRAYRGIPIDQIYE